MLSFLCPVMPVLFGLYGREAELGVQVGRQIKSLGVQCLSDEDGLIRDSKETVPVLWCLSCGACPVVPGPVVLVLSCLSCRACPVVPVCGACPRWDCRTLVGRELLGHLSVPGFGLDLKGAEIPKLSRARQL